MATGSAQVILSSCKVKWLKALAALLSAVLYVVSFPPFEIPEAAYVFAVPLLLSILFLPEAKGDWKYLLSSAWLGWLGVLYWISNYTDHLDGFFSPILGHLSWVLLSLVLSLFVLLWYFGAVFVFRRIRNRRLWIRLMGVLGLCGLWVVLEWVRSFLFTGFPWLPLSASQWQRPLILQIASWTGHYGISFVLISFNVGLSLYLVRMVEFRRASWYQRICPEFYLAILLLGGSLGVGMLGVPPQARQSASDRFSVGFVQPAIPGADKWNSELATEVFSELGRLHQLVSFLDPDIVVWPEAPTPYPVKGDSAALAWTNEIIFDAGVPVLLGNIAKEVDVETGETRWFNGAFLADPVSGIDIDRYYAKRKLVPFGEYVPFQTVLSFFEKVVPLPESFNPGEQALTLEVELNEVEFRVGSLICYEDIFPGLARDHVRKGADFFFVTTNDYWFGEAGAAEQHAAHSVLRAVEFRRPVVRSGNAGWSGWIDEMGQIRHVMTSPQGSVYFKGVEVADMKVSKFWAGHQSFYTRYGDWFAWFGLFLFAQVFWLRQFETNINP